MAGAAGRGLLEWEMVRVVSAPAALLAQVWGAFFGPASRKHVLRLFHALGELLSYSP